MGQIQTFVFILGSLSSELHHILFLPFWQIVKQLLRLLFRPLNCVLDLSRCQKVYCFQYFSVFVDVGVMDNLSKVKVLFLIRKRKEKVLIKCVPCTLRYIVSSILFSPVVVGIGPKFYGTKSDFGLDIGFPFLLSFRNIMFSSNLADWKVSVLYSQLCSDCLQYCCCLH